MRRVHLRNKHHGTSTVAHVPNDAVRPSEEMSEVVVSFPTNQVKEITDELCGVYGCTCQKITNADHLGPSGWNRETYAVNTLEVE